MKTKISIFFIMFLLAAIAVSGCLDSDNASDSSDEIPDSPEEEDPSVNSSDYSRVKQNPEFDANLTLADPVPQGLTFLSTSTPKSHGQNIGITDALFGYQGIYLDNDSNNAFLTIYNTNSSQDAASYLVMMQTNHTQTYGEGSQIENIRINGHDAVLLTVTSGAPANGKYIMAWTVNQLIVVVNGPVDYSLIHDLAVWSNL